MRFFFFFYFYVQYVFTLLHSERLRWSGDSVKLILVLRWFRVLVISPSMFQWSASIHMGLEGTGASSLMKNVNENNCM